MNIKVNEKLFFNYNEPIIRNPTEIIVEGIKKYLKSLNIATTDIAKKYSYYYKYDTRNY